MISLVLSIAWESFWNWLDGKFGLIGASLRLLHLDVSHIGGGRHI